MTAEMIFGIIMAVIALLGGGGAIGLSSRANSKHKEDVGRITTLEKEIVVLKEKVETDNATLNEIKKDIKDVKEEVYKLNMNLVRLNTQLEKEDK